MLQKRILAGMAICALALGGCTGSGGGSSDRSSTPRLPSVGGGETGTGLAFASTSDTADSSLRYVAINVRGQGASGNTGALDHDNGVITDGILAGTLNDPSRTEIALTDGGIANLTNPDNADFVRFFTLQGASFQEFGVVGAGTAAADIPTSGSADYSGTVNMSVFDGSRDTFTLTGDVNINARWSGSRGVDMAFSNLTGTNSTGAVGAGETGTLDIDNARISGAAFTGGQASGTGPLFDGFTAGASLSGTRGEFFGPNADEVGGTVSVLQNDVRVIGVYTGN